MQCKEKDGGEDMKCPSQRDWVSFYYDDPTGVKEALSAHLKECAHCRKEYASLSFFMSHIKKDRVALNRPDLDDIITQAQSQASRTGVALYREKIIDLLAQIRLRLLYQPQVVLITLLIMAGLVAIPFSVSKPVRLAEGDIAEVEIELALEDNNNLDILSDVLIPDDYSKNFSVTAIS
jgi:hypothetical protein